MNDSTMSGSGGSSGNSENWGTPKTSLLYRSYDGFNSAPMETLDQSAAIAHAQTSQKGYVEKITTEIVTIFRGGETNPLV